MKKGDEVKVAPDCLIVESPYKKNYLNGRIVYIGKNWATVQFEHFRESFYLNEIIAVGRKG